MKQLFATTARGFEELLKSELTELGAQDAKVAQGGVHYWADDETLYRTLLWSRLSSRILLPIVQAKVFSDLDLYSAVVGVNWLDYFDEKVHFFVDFNGTNQEIRHTQFGAMRVKDGIVDYFERHGRARPNVDKEQPDIRIHAYLNRDDVVLSLDLSGDALHMRGYREDTGKAPLRETLAAAIVLRSGWQKGTPLVDPMCGSGTLLIEAAQMEAQIAPQLYRLHWGFDFWQGYNQAAWEKVKEEALALAEAEKQRANPPHFYGFDLDHRVLQKAKQNAKNAGVAHLMQWQQGDVAAIKNPSPNVAGTVICNPPYGERLGTTPALIALYSVFGQRLKQQFAGWNASIFSGEPSLLDCLRLRSHRQFKAKNGPLDCVQKNYQIAERAEQGAVENALEFERTSSVSSDVAVDFANRLQKISRKLRNGRSSRG